MSLTFPALTAEVNNPAYDVSADYLNALVGNIGLYDLVMDNTGGSGSNVVTTWQDACDAAIPIYDADTDHAVSVWVQASPDNYGDATITEEVAMQFSGPTPIFPTGGFSASTLGDLQVGDATHSPFVSLSFGDMHLERINVFTNELQLQCRNVDIDGTIKSMAGGAVTPRIFSLMWAGGYLGGIEFALGILRNVAVKLEHCGPVTVGGLQRASFDCISDSHATAVYTPRQAWMTIMDSFEDVRISAQHKDSIRDTLIALKLDDVLDPGGMTNKNLLLTDCQMRNSNAEDAYLITEDGGAVTPELVTVTNCQNASLQAKGATGAFNKLLWGENNPTDLDTSTVTGSGNKKVSVAAL